MSDEKQIIIKLLDLTSKLMEENSLEEAMQIVADTALEMLPAEHTSVRIMDDSGTRLLCGARAGIGVDNAPMSFQLGEGVIGWVVASKQSALISDTARDARFKPPEDQGFPIGSILAVPLWSDDVVMGVLGGTSSEPSVFEQDHESLARLLANCTAPSFEKARLRRLSITDPLTMAINREHLLPRLHEEFERGLRHDTHPSLVLVDLDHFDQTIEEHGQEIGERLMRSFADRVRFTVRLSDYLVKYGGNEFVLLLPDMSLDRSAALAERIRRCFMESPLEISRYFKMIMTASVGVASWDGKEPADALVGRAEDALCEAHRLGKNQMVIARASVDAQPGDGERIACPADGCDGELVQEQARNGRGYFRCSADGCSGVIWHGGDLDLLD